MFNWKMSRISETRDWVICRITPEWTRLLGSTVAELRAIFHSDGNEHHPDVVSQSIYMQIKPIEDDDLLLLCTNSTLFKEHTATTGPNPITDLFRRSVWSKVKRPLASRWYLAYCCWHIIVINAHMGHTYDITRAAQSSFTHEFVTIATPVNGDLSKACAHMTRHVILAVRIKISKR